MEERNGSASKGQHSSQSDTSDVHRVGVRNIPFYPDKPSLWFSMLEGQFILSNITSDTTKFYHAIGMLDHQYAIEVEDVIESPPQTDKYDKLKSELIKRLSASKERKVKQLLDHEQLGDRKPSQFLRHLQHLAGPNVPEDFIRTIWTSRLPSSMQTIIASQATSSLESVADLADRIQDIVPASPCVASTSRLPSSHHQTTDDKFDMMAKQIERLTQQVHALTTHSSRSRSNARTRDGKGNRSRSRSQASYRKYPVCWYHSKFGSKAHSCVKPCNFQAENGQGGR
ncbi:uncharacterized protein LOC114365551 [Ostrinia furnacalis]|uniref:uncharacterized protein LOC114365551 n=1 Tax=Ostrinia furnacalis TaxID=93504 RepID=UPI00103F7359|nr:uncharacterized protein LOC114365551 [Ostrinia furnacalis]